MRIGSEIQSTRVLDAHPVTFIDDAVGSGPRAAEAASRNSLSPWIKSRSTSSLSIVPTMTASATPIAPSPLYTHLLILARAHAEPRDAAHLLSIRHPSAIHAWGHNYLVSRNPGLQKRMDNAAFAAHLKSTGRYLTLGQSQIHDIIVDENARTAVVHMSYLLSPKGSEETIEHDLIWVLKFTKEGEGDEVLIEESVEFIDAAAGAHLGKVIRALNGGKLEEGATGSIVLGE